MKKPNFIEIRFPGRKSTFQRARGKYFKRLENKVLKVNFGREKERKIFDYLVLESSFKEYWLYWSKKKDQYWSLKLGLKVPKDDHDKVL